MAFLAMGARTVWMVPDDEALYALAGRWLHDGILPYRDYFFAHPPGRLLLAWLVMGGTPIGVGGLRVLELGSFALAGLAAHRLLAGAGAARWGWFAALLLLFTGPTLWEGPFFRGMGPTAALTAWAMVCSAERRWLATGLLVGAAGLVAFHAAPIGLALLAFAALAGREALLHFAVGPLLLALSLAALALLWGDAFVDPVLRYHLAKPPAPSAVAGQWRGFLTLAAAPVVLAMLGGLLLALAPRLGAAVEAPAPPGRPRAWMVAASSALAMAGGLLLLGTLHRYYFLLLMPPLAVTAAFGVAGIGRLTPRRAVPALAALAVVLSCWELPVNQWSRASGLPVAEARLRDLARQVDVALPAGAAVSGDTLLAPWISAITGRPLASRLLDANWQRFAAGLLSVDEYFARIEGAGAVITADSHGILRVPGVADRLGRDYRELLSRDDMHGLYTVRVWVPRRARP